VEARVWKCGVVADGVSLVKNYRGQFDKIIRESGYPDLVEELRNKSKEAKLPKPKKKWFVYGCSKRPSARPQGVWRLRRTR